MSAQGPLTLDLTQDFLPDVFERQARLVLDQERLVHRWEVLGGSRRRLVFPKQCDGGFEIVAEAESYGLYAFADAWHSTAWDPVVPGWSPEAMAIDFLGFLRTLLSPEAALHIHHAGGRPFKWVMEYPDETGLQEETTGLLFFNYFGARSVTTLRNTVLPARYGQSHGHS